MGYRCNDATTARNSVLVKESGRGTGQEMQQASVHKTGRRLKQERGGGGWQLNNVGQRNNSERGPVEQQGEGPDKACLHFRGLATTETTPAGRRAGRPWPAQHLSLDLSLQPTWCRDRGLWRCRPSA